MIENATNQIEKREFSQVNLPKLKEAIRSSREWLGVLKQASDSNNKDAVRITEIFARMSGSAKPKLETMTSDEVKQFLERLVAVGSKSAGKETSVSCQMNSACLLEKDYIGLVVENFVSNALKYGGKKIDILAEEKENKFIFSVTDNGEKGISKETLAAIFQTKETNTKMGSNGVGLPVSDIIAKLVLGGSIRAVSEPGSTTFALEIPLGK